MTGLSLYAMPIHSNDQQYGDNSGVISAYSKALLKNMRYDHKELKNEHELLGNNQ